MTSFFKTAAALIISCICVSCSSTPETRIAKNPEIFAQLTQEQKGLVRRGLIDKGMSPGAVFLAWGGPNTVADGEIGGKQYVRWIYTTLEPVITPGWGGGYWGPWGRRWGWGYYGGFYNDVSYIPVDAGYVLFRNDVVESWEKRNF